jgi:hypothetical protein
MARVFFKPAANGVDAFCANGWIQVTISMNEDAGITSDQQTSGRERSVPIKERAKPLSEALFPLTDLAGFRFEVLFPGSVGFAFPLCLATSLSVNYIGLLLDGGSNTAECRLNLKSDDTGCMSEASYLG